MSFKIRDVFEALTKAKSEYEVLKILRLLKKSKIEKYSVIPFDLLKLMKS